MEAVPFTHDEYLVYGREAVIERTDALSDILALPKGVYVFGHNHLQFHMEYDGRLFVNPGSCGAAADRDTTAAYTILERTGNSWQIEERRVNYDVQKVIHQLHASSFYEACPVWCGFVEAQLLTGLDCMGSFFIYLAEFSQSNFPVSNELWHVAVKAWEEGKR